MMSSASWCPMDGPVGVFGQLDPVGGGAGQDKLICAATVQRRRQAHCHC